MKAIMIMFDSLNRHFLPNYGCSWTVMPQFQRLAERALTFDCFYGGSMPCMPARRELHTGRYNFLHSSWCPMQPFDDSVIPFLLPSTLFSPNAVIKSANAQICSPITKSHSSMALLFSSIHLF